MAKEDYSSMQGGPQYNFRQYPDKAYSAFLQNKEFVDFLAKRFSGDISKLEEAVKGFKVEFPNIKIPEFNTYNLEEKIEMLNKTMQAVLAEQQTTNYYIKELISAVKDIR